MILGRFRRCRERAALSTSVLGTPLTVIVTVGGTATGVQVGGYELVSKLSWFGLFAGGFSVRITLVPPGTVNEPQRLLNTLPPSDRRVVVHRHAVHGHRTRTRVVQAYRSRVIADRQGAARRRTTGHRSAEEDRVRGTGPGNRERRRVRGVDLFVLGVADIHRQARDRRRPRRRRMPRCAASRSAQQDSPQGGARPIGGDWLPASHAKRSSLVTPEYSYACGFTHARYRGRAMSHDRGGNERCDTPRRY